MIRKTVLIAATLALSAAGAVAANAASFGVAGSNSNQTMIQHVHDGYGEHFHGPRWDGPRWGGPRWDGPRWDGPRWDGPRGRCSMVRARCAEIFRPGGFRWERCVVNRGC